MVAGDSRRNSTSDLRLSAQCP